VTSTIWVPMVPIFYNVKFFGMLLKLFS